MTINNDLPGSLANLVSPPNERFYLLVFGSESKPKRAKSTHTWATMVRVVQQGSEPPVVEPHTISWMPASLKIRPWSLRVEPGKNLELSFTIEEMLKHEEQIALWGPYEVGYGFYQRFLVQKQFMESGQVGYQCIDSLCEAARTGRGCDCIHAVTDMDPQYDRKRYPLSYFGLAGSQNVVRQINERPIIRQTEQCHDWLIPYLSIDKYPIEKMKWNGTVNPASQTLQS
ncbi:hypothetical protein BH11PLA2_BH11PLA2_45370 [soil metagenome]